MRIYIVLTCAAALAGCTALPRHEAAPARIVRGPLGPAAAAAPAALDHSTQAQRQAALAAGPSGAMHRLGESVASLGDPARPGFWLRTPLVKAPRKGRVALGGKSLKVDLLPGNGPGTSGSQLSLAAYRALGLNLTALPKITVYAR
ncbi:hypothetical protein U879_02680 [Defluviimonas sp. 20V17]|uniref:D-galactarate dehydratase n=1 Tax=Allgaiera indica TaxID=765699 RepID=A0AAN4UTZ4_9RHOB|nr:hypothetical protein [Allgaiera indica]KDB05238.1 hypothetical protein U879_02680 [Defluviimonas sp. 20V17]GHE05012.1 hypothetical protein GCM10008024_34370 [Allgaiera indica]SDX61159.1 hypothetical protein SAMN05444006_12157 [Allgaiera indica]